MGKRLNLITKIERETLTRPEQIKLYGQRYKKMFSDKQYVTGMAYYRKMNKETLEDVQIILKERKYNCIDLQNLAPEQFAQAINEILKGEVQYSFIKR